MAKNRGDFPYGFLDKNFTQYFRGAKQSPALAIKPPSSMSGSKSNASQFIWPRSALSADRLAFLLLLRRRTLVFL